MLKEFEDRIENAKNKQFRMLERFHIGDAVYPFWLKGLVVYGIVTDVDTVARKVICDFNGVRRQFCPEDLMHVNPELVNASTAKKRTASKDGSYSKQDETHLSGDTDNGISATCKKCGGEIAVSYDEKSAKSDFVCTQCGQRISEDKLNSKTKKAMKENQMMNLRVASKEVSNEKELSDLLKRTIAGIDRGMHCWCQLPSGNWFCTEDEDGDDGKGILCCYINEKTDSLGYPMGEMLVDCGIVHDESECDEIAKYAFECDAELADEDDDDEPDPDEYDEGHAKEWMEKHSHGWYNSENDYGTGDEDDDRFASKKAIAQELARVAKMLIRRG